MAEDEERPVGAWGEYRQLILAELRRLSTAISRMDEKLETKLNAHAELRSRVGSVEASIEALEMQRSDLKWLVGTVIAIAALLIALFKH